MSAIELTIPLGAATKKKLVTLAKLSPSFTSADLEDEAAAVFDLLITERLGAAMRAHLSETLGLTDDEVTLILGTTETPSETDHAAYTLKFPVEQEQAAARPAAVRHMALTTAGELVDRRPKSFAEAERTVAGDRDEGEQEAFAGIETRDEVSGHELSNDDDTGETKSLAEQVDDDPEAAVFRDSLQPQVRNVGGNHEAFLDASMGPPDRDTDEIPSATRGYAGMGLHGERPRPATKSFSHRQMKGRGARVTPHTGDEDGDDL